MTMLIEIWRFYACFAFASYRIETRERVWLALELHLGRTLRLYVARDDERRWRFKLNLIFLRIDNTSEINVKRIPINEWLSRCYAVPLWRVYLFGRRIASTEVTK